MVDQLLTNPDGYPRPKDYDNAEVEVVESPMVSERAIELMCMCTMHPGEELVDRCVVCACIYVRVCIYGALSACITLTPPPTHHHIIHTGRRRRGQQPVQAVGRGQQDGGGGGGAGDDTGEDAALHRRAAARGGIQGDGLNHVLV